MNWWDSYKKHVRDVILNDSPHDQEHVSYWRNNVFCEILTYLIPLSIIALIPSVYMAFKNGILVVGYVDLFAFFSLMLITVVPGIKLETRKGIFIFILYSLSVILLYYLPLPSPGILFLLVSTIFSSLIFSSFAAYLSAWTNAAICLVFTLLLYLGIETPVSHSYTMGAWIAVSSNLVLVSFACAKCLDLLFAGLNKSLKANKIAEFKLERANRLYQFISQINQTIVHVKDAETLFRQSCDIALKYGNYNMAWIGRFDSDQKLITLLDSCGIPKPDLKLFTNIPYETKAAQMHVLRTGTHFLCNDVKTTLAVGNWEPFAKDHNIGSFIVLPIKKSGKVFGTFNLYAIEPNYFGTDDIDLLNEVIGDISFALDLFEKAERHKEAELQLQKNFEALEAVSKEQSAILNTLPASIALIDHTGTIVKVNQEWLQFGQTNGLHNTYPHIGTNYIEVSENAFESESDDGQQMGQGLREILSGEREYYTMEYPCDSPTEKRWFRTDVRPFKSNFLNGAVVMHINITERKKSDDLQILTSVALQHAINDLNKIMDSSLDVICAVDADGTFLKVSAASETVWGYKPEELIGTPIFDILYHEDLQKTQLSAKTVMTGSNLNHFENRYVRKDGTLVPIEWSARWDAKDQIRYGVARDVSEKKRLQNVIDNERQRFYDLFSEAPSSMGVLRGSDHVFEIVNPPLLQLIGKKDIIGKTVKEVLPEVFNQGFIELLDEVYKSGNTFSSSEVLMKLDIHGNGQLHDTYLNLMYRAHRTKTDTIDGILFFAINVTEQVLLRKEIEESEAKLKKAQELLHISNWEIDLTTKKSLWSDEIYTLLDLNREDVPPSLHTFLSMIHPDDFEVANAKVEESFETYDAGSFSVRINKSNGDLTYVYAEWKFEVDTNDKPIRLYGILQDITERKKSEQEIEFKAQLLDTIGQSVIATDLNGTVTFWNKAAVEIYGWTLDEAIGGNILTLMPTLQARADAEVLMKKLSQGESWSGEHYVQRKNGDVFPAYISNSSVNDEFGKQIGIIGVSNDISERKELEEERIKITDELLQRNRDLEQFTFIISHNLRAPAANIIGFTEYFQDETITPQEQKELLKGLASSVSGLDTIIKDINTILQVKRDINDKKESIVFSKIVTNIINSIGNTIDKHQVTIKTDFNEVDDIFSLKVYLHSIFYNLISNSIKYRRPDVPPLIDIKSKRDNDKIILTFSDNGLGIDLNKKGDKVFGLYQRFHNHVEGKGMGLFMVKTQVEAIGGKIRISSELNKGTEFTIVFEIQ